MKNDIRLKFPEGFLWGSATSSHQVEGGNDNDWSRWERSPGRIAHLKKKGLIEKYGFDNFLSRKAGDHSNRFWDEF